MSGRPRKVELKQLLLVIVCRVGAASVLLLARICSRDDFPPSHDLARR